MNLSAYDPGQLKTHYKVAKVVDGDGLFVTNIFSGEETEIRLLGIDAPEIKKCKKLLQDERELHLPGQLLLQLGKESFRYLCELLPVGTPITLYTEGSNSTDIYGRTLAYVFLSSGATVNETLVREGYAKPFVRYYCSQQLNYQLFSLEAKSSKRGHYEFVENF